MMHRPKMTRSLVASRARQTRAVALCAASLLMAGFANAGPLHLQDVPAEAAWVVHVDADASRGGVLGSGVLRKLQGANGQGLDRVNTRFGMDLAKEFHGLTIFGPSVSTNEGVCLLFVDQPQKVLDALHREAGVKARTLNPEGHALTAWTVRETEFFAAIIPGNGKPDQRGGRAILVIGSSERHVTRTLALLAGHGLNAADAGEPLVESGPGPGSAFFAAVRRGDQPLGKAALGQIARGLRIDIGERAAPTPADPPSLYIDARVWTADEKQAQSAQSLVTAVLAIAGQRVQADPRLAKDPRLANVPTIVSEMVAKADGNSVTITLEHSAPALLGVTEAVAEMLLSKRVAPPVAADLPADASKPVPAKATPATPPTRTGG